LLVLYEKKQNKKETYDQKEIDLADLERFASYKQHKEFLRIPNTQVGNKTIIEWFTIDKTSFWWFIYPVISPKFDELLTFIDRFNNCLNYYSPHLVKLRGCYDKISIIRQICKSQNIPLEISIKEYFLFFVRDFLKKKIKKLRHKRITEKKQSKRLRCYKARKHFQKSLSDYVIITAPGVYRRNKLDPMTGLTKKGEYILQPIIDCLREYKIPVLCFDLDYTFRGDTKVLKERLQEEIRWIPIEVLLRKSKSQSVLQSVKILQKNMKKLEQKNLKDLFVYKNISFWDCLKPKFEEIFLEPYLPTFLHLIDKLEEFFQINKPKVIIQVYETGPYAKAFEIVAKKLGIRTIGIQHGTINDTHPDYMYAEIQTGKLSIGNPIPDTTFVFGEHYKKVLTEQGFYPSEKIDVIGNPEFYDIEKIKINLNKKTILKKYDIPDKKIVLVALSSFLFENSEKIHDTVLLDLLYEELKDVQNLVVLIRPHPSSKDKVRDLLKNRYKCSNFKISESTLIEDIFICDVLVTTFSTVAVDATFFEKPIIFANITDEDFSSTAEIHRSMVEHEVAILCSRDELVSKILSIKKGEKWETQKSNKRKDFLKSYFNYGQSVDLKQIIFGN